MIPVSILASIGAPAASGSLSFADALSFLTTLGLLAVVYQLQQVKRRLAAMEKRLAAARTQAAPPPVAIPRGVPTNDALSAETLAVVAAACHVAVGRPTRIVAISEAAGLDRVWSMEGRRQIFASHQVR